MHLDLRVLGFLCCAAKIGVTDKFDLRARKCVFLGYTFGFKGYKLHDLENKNTFHNRDILFHENVFPFKKNLNEATLLSDNTSIPLLRIGEHPSITSDPVSLATRTSSFPLLGVFGSITYVLDTTPVNSSFNQSTHIEPIGSFLDSIPSSNHHTEFSSDSSNPHIDPSSAVMQPPIQRSSRARNPLVWLKDFVQPQYQHTTVINHSELSSVALQPSPSNSFTASTNLYRLFTYSNLAHLSLTYMASVASVLQHLEPSSYAQATLCPEWEKTM